MGLQFRPELESRHQPLFIVYLFIVSPFIKTCHSWGPRGSKKNCHKYVPSSPVSPPSPPTPTPGFGPTPGTHDHLPPPSAFSQQ